MSVVPLYQGEITITLKADVKEFTYKLNASNIQIRNLIEDYPAQRIQRHGGLAYLLPNAMTPIMHLSADIIGGELQIKDEDSGHEMTTQIVDNRLLEVL